MNDENKSNTEPSSRMGVFVKRYEHHLSVAAFVLGFISDNLLLPPVEHYSSHIILGLYMLSAAAGILLIQLVDSGQIKTGLVKRLHPFLPATIQFLYGGLFSSLFVFYSRSASIGATWPFMTMLALMIIGNEIFRDRYKQLEFQVSVLFVTVFGFMIFYVPIIFNRIDATMFVLSGLVSLLIITLFIMVLLTLVPQAIRGSAKYLALAVGGLYVMINILYFTNSIPPLPLALRSAGVYHSVVKNDAGEYVGRGEYLSWFNKYISRSPPYHHTDDLPVYFYSAIYAPTALYTPVYHEWQYFDQTKRGWVTASQVKFPIFGGRENGYRSYSTKENVTPGKWRVLVKTERGQELGQAGFTVIASPAEPELFERKL